MRILLPIQYFYGRINKCLNKMTTVKKIILFLFGIILIVFGNKAAINTILKDNDGSKEIEPSEKETALTSPVIMEEVNAAEETEAKKTDNIAITEKTTVAQSEEVSSKETIKTSAPKQTEKAAKTASDAKVVEKKEEQKVKEADKTKIEPVKEESAAASE